MSLAAAAAVDLLAQPVRERARLRAAVRLRLDAVEPEPGVLVPAARVGDEQLDARHGAAGVARVEQPQLAAVVGRGPLPASSGAKRSGHCGA